MTNVNAFLTVDEQQALNEAIDVALDVLKNDLPEDDERVVKLETLGNLSALDAKNFMDELLSDVENDEVDLTDGGAAAEALSAVNLKLDQFLDMS
jgi:hypothetical protein